MVDVHTIATFAFAELQRDPAFRRRFPWLRHTVVCVESDLVDEVISGRMAHYFPDGGTIACYYPNDKRFAFVSVGAPGKADDKERVRGAHVTSDGRLVINDKHRTTTVGMVVDMMYGSPHRDAGEASTADIEKRLALV